MLERTYQPIIKVYSPAVSSTEIYLDDVLTIKEINDILSLVYKEVAQKLENLEKEFNELCLIIYPTIQPTLKSIRL